MLLSILFFPRNSPRSTGSNWSTEGRPTLPRFMNPVTADRIVLTSSLRSAIWVFHALNIRHRLAHREFAKRVRGVRLGTKLESAGGKDHDRRQRDIRPATASAASAGSSNGTRYR